MDISRNENDAITTIVLGVLAVVVLIAKSEYAVYVIVAIISILGGALGGGRMDTKKLLQIFQQLQGASGSDGSSVVEDAVNDVENAAVDKLEEKAGIKDSESQDVSGEEDAQAVDEVSNKEQAQVAVDNSADVTSQDASVDNSSSSNNADQTAQPATTEQAATVTLSDDQMDDLASRVTANMVKNQGSPSTNDAGASTTQ